MASPYKNSGYAREDGKPNVNALAVSGNIHSPYDDVSTTMIRRVIT